MAGLGNPIIEQVDHIIESHGTSISVYISPTYTYNDEGTATAISKGTATAASAVIFTETPGEAYERMPEGVEEIIIYTVYLKQSVGTITKKSLLYFNSTYYRIVDMHSHQFEDKSKMYYQLVVEKIANQSIVS